MQRHSHRCEPNLNLSGIKYWFSNTRLLLGHLFSWFFYLVEVAVLFNGSFGPRDLQVAFELQVVPVVVVPLIHV